jgi:hypothetical protein
VLLVLGETVKRGEVASWALAVLVFGSLAAFVVRCAWTWWRR